MIGQYFWKNVAGVQNVLYEFLIVFALGQDNEKEKQKTARGDFRKKKVVSSKEGKNWRFKKRIVQEAIMCCKSLWKAEIQGP